MKINSDIISTYIEGKSVEPFQEQWFFKAEGYSFVEPSYRNEDREAVKRIYSLLKDAIADFTPCNTAIWDALFPTWRNHIDNITVNLIVGYPEPNDACVLKGPDGQSNVILDLGLWTKYEGKCDIASVVHNLLTHELCHVFIGAAIDKIDDDIESSDYLTNLDANTFHEGFAHLVSYENYEIDQVNWESDELRKVKARNRERMQSALHETDPVEQKKFLYDAIFGDYYEKYACMCGMLYLADCWRANGISGLKEAFQKGYHGFARRTIGE